MDPGTADDIAFRAATKALELRGDSDVQKIFQIFGADISTVEGRQTIRENWEWLTDTRKGTQFIRRTTWGAALVAAVGAAFMALGQVIKLTWAALARGVQ